MLIHRCRPSVAPLESMMVTATRGHRARPGELAAVGAAPVLPPSGPSERVTPAASMPRWEAVSIKPCDASSLPANFRGGRSHLSPGRMMLNCQPALGVIASAYLIFAGGKTHPAYVAGPAGTVIEGGPAWIRTARYTITAKAETAVPIRERLRQMTPRSIQRSGSSLAPACSQRKTSASSSWWIRSIGVTRTDMESHVPGPVFEGASDGLRYCTTSDARR